MTYQKNVLTLSVFYSSCLGLSCSGRVLDIFFFWFLMFLGGVWVEIEIVVASEREFWYSERHTYTTRSKSEEKKKNKSKTSEWFMFRLKYIMEIRNTCGDWLKISEKKRREKCSSSFAQFTQHRMNRMNWDCVSSLDIEEENISNFSISISHSHFFSSFK